MAISKDVGKTPWMYIGLGVAIVSIILNLVSNSWRYTLILIIGVVLAVYGFLTR